MEIVEKKPVPVYQVECYECKTKIQYRKRDVHGCYITCPVCGVSLWADTTKPIAVQVWITRKGVDDG